MTRFSVRLLAVVAVALAAGSIPLPGGAANTPHPCYWVFLNKGEGRSKLSGMDKDVVAKMQSDHVGNLGELGKQGRGCAAGPLGDNGFVRGIVVLTVNSPAEVKDCFKNDPFVQNDILAVEFYRWAVDPSRFQKPVEPFKMAKHTLGVVKKGKEFGKTKVGTDLDAMTTLLPTLKPLASKGELAISGPLIEAGDFLGILYFGAPDSEPIKNAVEQDPAIKEGRVIIEWHPQFMGEGVLPVPAAKK